MKEFIGYLFFHFFIMMMIPFVNITLSKVKTNGKEKIVFLLTIVFALFLSMSFPVRIADGIAFDFKFIPVFIAFFYIGPLAGGVAIGAVLGITFITNLSGILTLMMNYFIMIPIFGVTYKFFQKRKVSLKISIGVVFYLLITVTRTIALIQSGHAHDIIHLITFSIVSIFTLAMIIYLIEMNKLHLMMMEQLQNADKLNAISQLAASVAHEIRNPMTSIRGFLQIMKDENNLTSKQQMFIAVSLEELDRTHHIIGDFLSLARPTTHGNETVPLSKTILDIADFMQPYAVMSNVDLTADIESDLIISGNVNECKQLFINIVKNGIEAMPNGGKLELIAYKNKSHVIINIKDNGVGLTPHQLKQLGQPYYSTKTKGTGLGLMISFDIIKRMKGEYKIESNENNGTSFNIIFPL